jgi:hypothetical protein
MKKNGGRKSRETVSLTDATCNKLTVLFYLFGKTPSKLSTFFYIKNNYRYRYYPKPPGFIDTPNASVSHLHRLYTDPDKAFYANADPDLALKMNVDSCGSRSRCTLKNIFFIRQIKVR